MTLFNTSQTSQSERPGVQHNDAQNRFELEVDGRLAHVDYRREGDVMIFHHTYVPESVRGQGYAGKVVSTALNFARQNNLSVVPRCSYVARYMDRHPEYSHLKVPG